MFKGMWWAIKGTGVFLFKIKGLLPFIFIFAIFMIQFIHTANEQGITIAVLDVAQQIFTADYTIHQLTDKAIFSPQVYTVFDFFEIISAYLVILFFFRILMKIDLGSGNLSTFFGAVIIFFLIELVALGVFIATDQIQTDNVLKTYQENIPLWSGAIYGIRHIDEIVPFYNSIVDSDKTFSTNTTFQNRNDTIT